jgi:6-phosphogluconolactonase
MTNEALLSKISVPAENVHRVATDDGDPQTAAARYEQEIRKVLGDPARFDLILLGLGTNGHTASLFPHCPALKVRDRLVVTDYIEEVKMNRITFTAPLINDAHAILFLLSGHDKAAVFKEVVLGPLDPERLPSQLIEPAHGTLTWLADKDAAADVR